MRARTRATRSRPCWPSKAISRSPQSCDWCSSVETRNPSSASQGSSISSACWRGQLDRGDPLLEERVDQLLLVLEAPVDGADADAGVVRDVIQRHVQPALGEDLAGRREDALAVPRGILAKRALRGLCEQLGSGHERSLAPKW